MTLRMGGHRLEEGQTKGGRVNMRKKKSKRIEGGRREGERRGGGGGHVSSVEPTSCPDPKMERL